MLKTALVVLSLLTASPLAFAHDHEGKSHSASLKARADIKNSEGKKIGTAVFTEAQDGVDISVQVSKITPGEHGIHIHEVGKCEEPDFKSAGSHFNPQSKQHGLENPQGAHGGDLPNLVVPKGGRVRARMTAQGVTLRQGQFNTLIRPEGTSLVIHAGPDDQKTDPAGNSGGRIACGVIEEE